MNDTRKSNGKRFPSVLGPGEEVEIISDVLYNKDNTLRWIHNYFEVAGHRVVFYPKTFEGQIEE